MSTATKDIRGLREPRNGSCILRTAEVTVEYVWNNPLMDDRSPEKQQRLIHLSQFAHCVSVCLPRMGMAYVTRSVFEPSHRCLLVRCPDSDHGSRPVAGLAVRPFFECGFAEVVFLVVSSSFQCRQIGRLLLRLFKALCVTQLTSLEYLVTYATDEALGFFTKMGFGELHSNHAMSKTVSECIKQYSGSVLMISQIYPGIDYLTLDRRLESKRKEILAKVCDERKKQVKRTGKKGLPTYAVPSELTVDCKIILKNLPCVRSFSDESLLVSLIQECTSKGIITDRDLYYVAKYGMIDPFNDQGKRAKLNLIDIFRSVKVDPSHAMNVNRFVDEMKKEIIDGQSAMKEKSNRLDDVSQSMDSDLPTSWKRSVSMRVQKQKQSLSQHTPFITVADLPGNTAN